MQKRLPNKFTHRTFICTKQINLPYRFHLVKMIFCINCLNKTRIVTKCDIQNIEFIRMQIVLFVLSYNMP